MVAGLVSTLDHKGILEWVLGVYELGFCLRRLADGVSIDPIIQSPVHIYNYAGIQMLCYIFNFGIQSPAPNFKVWHSDAEVHFWYTGNLIGFILV